MRIRSRVLVILALAVAAAVTLGYSTLRAGAGGWDPETVTLDLEVTVQETITMRMVLANRGPREAVLSFNTGQQHDFVVFRRSGTEWVTVYKWSHTMMFTQALTRLAIAPGQSHTFTETWQPEGPGEYRILGLVPERHRPIQVEKTVVVR